MKYWDKVIIKQEYRQDYWLIPTNWIIESLDWKWVTIRNSIWELHLPLNRITLDIYN